MRRLTMFWGCTIPARFPFIEKATRLALAELEAELVEPAGFTCCPEAGLVKAANERVFQLTAARNLAVAEKIGLPLLTPCNGCYSTFKSVLSELRSDWRLRDELNETLHESGLHFEGDVDVWHFVEWVSEDVGPAALAKRVRRPLAGMKVALHYGCHLLRPSPAIRWDSPTSPTKFEALLKALGATVVEYESRMDCCGGALDRVGDRAGALAMCRSKLEDAQAHGADTLVVSCPSCFQQFDLNQAAVIRETGAPGLPILYFSEILALAFGLAAEELGLDMHRISVLPFLEKWEEKLAKRELVAQSFNLAELHTCATCHACDTDCPVARSNDEFVPSALLAELVAGDLDALLENPAIWQCLDCYTCYERCHSRLGMARVFEQLKRLAREAGKAPAPARSGYDTFLSTGLLGSGRASARETLGLPPLPESGSEELKHLLAKADVVRSAAESARGAGVTRPAGDRGAAKPRAPKAGEQS